MSGAVAAKPAIEDDDYVDPTEFAGTFWALIDSLKAEDAARQSLLAKMKFENERGNQMLIEAGLQPIPLC